MSSFKSITLPVVDMEVDNDTINLYMNITLNKERKERIIKMREKGKSYREIGEILKISGQRVHKILTTVIKREVNCSMCSVLLKTGDGRKYCLKCLSNGLIGEGRDFLREQVRVRDKHTCQSCFKKWEKGMRRFDVHHKISKIEGKKGRKYKNNKSFSDMITMCHKCHLNLPVVIEKMKKGYRKGKRKKY